MTTVEARLVQTIAPTMVFAKMEPAFAKMASPGLTAVKRSAQEIAMATEHVLTLFAFAIVAGWVWIARCVVA